MNYFAHYFLDHQPGEHEYNTGLLLPDITRNLVTPFHHPPQINESWANQFYSGCLQHYASDKKFHASSLFTYLLDLTKYEVEQVDLSEQVQRKWFLCHIMAELMLDRILVWRFPETLAAFYQSLQSINDAQLKSYLEAYHLKDTLSFFDFFNHFRSVQYIFYYTNNNKFVYSLNRIMIKAKVGSMPQNDQEKLEVAGQNLFNQLNSNAEQLIKQLKELHHA
ncbi:MAG: hypothetical protein ACK5UI_10080 [Bacteroidota bacterium]|jgi:hypothetical protein